MEQPSYLSTLGTVATIVSTVCDLLMVRRGQGMSGYSRAPSQRTYMVMGVFLMLTWGAVAFDYYDRHYSKPQWGSQPLKQVRHKTFAAETVILDGHEFIDCDFNQVTFVYEGKAPARLINVRVTYHEPGKGGVKFRSGNSAISQTVILMYSLFRAAGVPIQNFQMRVNED